MKRFLKLAAILALLALPCQAGASALVIDWTTGSTKTTSGDTIFQVSATSGTYTTGIAAGDTVISNLSNFTGVYSVQPNTIAFGDSLTYSAMGGVTYEIVAQFSNVNDATHWAGASTYVLNPGGTAISGNSLYVIAGRAADEGYDFMRLLLRQALSGVSPIREMILRSVHK